MADVKLSKTFSISDQASENEQKPEDTPRGPEEEVKDKLESNSYIQYSDLSTFAAATAASAQKSNRDKKAVNPFMGGSSEENGNKHLVKEFEPPTLIETDKPPDYAAERKKYIGSPNLQIRKRPNIPNHLLPKAFSIDIGGSEGNLSNKRGSIQIEPTQPRVPNNSNRNSIAILSIQERAISQVRQSAKELCSGLEKLAEESEDEGEVERCETGQMKGAALEKAPENTCSCQCILF